MSNTTIYFLTEAEDIEEAKSIVDSYLENEHLSDYWTVLDEGSGPLEMEQKELMNFIRNWNWKMCAKEYLNQAQKHKESDDLYAYGYRLICAGELYSQCLTVNTYVFNIESEDYSVPDDDMGWWVIVVDFH